MASLLLHLLIHNPTSQIFPGGGDKFPVYSAVLLGDLIFDKSEPLGSLLYSES